MDPNRKDSKNETAWALIVKYAIINTNGWFIPLDIEDINDLKTFSKIFEKLHNKFFGQQLVLEAIKNRSYLDESKPINPENLLEWEKEQKDVEMGIKIAASCKRDCGVVMNKIGSLGPEVEMTGFISILKRILYNFSDHNSNLKFFLWPLWKKELLQTMENLIEKYKYTFKLTFENCIKEARINNIERMNTMKSELLELISNVSKIHIYASNVILKKDYILPPFLLKEAAITLENENLTTISTEEEEDNLNSFFETNCLIQDDDEKYMLLSEYEELRHTPNWKNSSWNNNSDSSILEQTKEQHLTMQFESKMNELDNEIQNLFVETEVRVNSENHLTDKQPIDFI